MGEVFRAVDEQLGRPVAVKLMLPSDRDPRAVERFHREARSAAMLNDPHVVAVYDFGQYGDQFFLVMELVEGRTVGGELTEHGPLPKDRAIDIVEQAALGLAAAHRENVVHRDVKPGNLLLTPDGTVKVADFGIAHRSDDGATALTATGQLIGSALYLAPERAKGGQGGKPSDVYSLGCVLYQLLTGQPPFTAEHPTAILYQHVDAVPAPPSAVRPELAGAFEAELFRMLAKEPADRPTAAAIAAGSLRATTLAATAVVPAAGAVVPAGVATVPAGAVEPPPVQPSPSGWGGRQKALLAGGIALVAVAAAVLVGVILNNNDPKSPTTDIGPGPGAVSTTPGATTTSNSGSTQPTQPTRSTSTRPSQTPSRQNSPTPTPSGTPTTSSQPPTSTPTTPPPSTAPTTSNTPPPTTAPSNTPPPDNTPTPPPASGTPDSQ